MGTNGASAPSSEPAEGCAVQCNAVALLAGQNRALELIAGNAPLGDVLDFLMHLIESQAPGLLCSVLLLENGHLRIGAAPSLPDAFNRAIDGVAIGPSVGSCGTAAYTGECVIVTDIATDPLWADAAEVALEHDLRACWSTPILAADGDVLGTFAVYYHEPSAPRPAHLSLVAWATHLAGIAIERRRKDEELAERARMLAEAALRKDEFIALLAHELRNPLAPIAAALPAMRQSLGDPARVEQCCAVIGRQVDVLTRLVDDLLDLSRVTRGAVTLRKERTTAAALIAGAVEAARPLLEQRRHTLRTSLPDAPIEIDADPIRIVQVLSNLLNNAAKYTEPGGHVEIGAAREGREVVLSVRDDGIGIAPEMLDRVFDLFVQAAGADALAPGGLGIGLTLVKSLVELHGGRVEARSEGQGRGTEIVVRLPSPAETSGAGASMVSGPPCTSEAAGAPSHRAPASPRRLLIVDDNIDAAETLADAMRDGQTEIAVALDGPTALAEARARRPDAVIIDIGLPGMDGYEVARRLRAACPGALRLIALTGYSHEADQLRAREAGFDVHLVKPADVDRILAAVIR